MLSCKCHCHEAMDAASPVDSQPQGSWPPRDHFCCPFGSKPGGLGIAHPCLNSPMDLDSYVEADNQASTKAKGFIAQA